MKKSELEANIHKLTGEDDRVASKRLDSLIKLLGEHGEQIRQETAEKIMKMYRVDDESEGLEDATIIVDYFEVPLKIAKKIQRIHTDFVEDILVKPEFNL